MDEWKLIKELRQKTGKNPRGPIGIGDDAALVTCPAGKCLVSTDMLMEGIDFLIGDDDCQRELQPSSAPNQAPRVGAWWIGRKAAAVNLSDMAAMAARPVAIFASLALPRERSGRFAEELMAGIRDMAAEEGAFLAGGDTNSWNGPCVVSLTILGDPTHHGPVLRTGASAGDWLFVTGALGGSLRERQFRFAPRCADAIRLHEVVPLRAMLDLSDGLAGDVRHLFSASGTGPRGAMLRSEQIPIHNDVPTNLSAEEQLRHALTDGEDFELLFAVSPADGKRLLTTSPCEASLTHIGELIDEPGLFLRDLGGAPREIDWQGWTHSVGNLVKNVQQETRNKK